MLLQDEHRYCENLIVPQWRLHEDQVPWWQGRNILPGPWPFLPVLIEYLKELKYNEIGGLYVKHRVWTLVTYDRGVTDTTNGRSEADFYIDYHVKKTIPPIKKMQSHVIVKPRKSPLKLRKRNAEKWTFVTH